MNLPAASPSLSPRHAQDLLWVSAPVLTLTESSSPVQAIALPAWPQARRLEFLAGRTLAAAALRQWSFPEVVARRSDGAPLWPPGVVGSIAHGGGQAMVAIARTPRWKAIGVDVEPDAPLPADAAQLVLRAEDRLALSAAFGAAAPTQDRLVFCAKECVHKALHPLRGAWLEFDEVTVQFPLPGQWIAEPVSAKAIEAFAGELLGGAWWRAEGCLWSLLAIPSGAMLP